MPILLLLFTLIFVTPAYAQNNGPTEPAYLYRAIVTNVVDGDTVDVDIDLGFYVWIRNQRIRLIGIDAPEKKGEERPQGLEATKFLNNLIHDQEIILRTYRARDGGDKKGKWGRWLGRIYFDGLDINQHMIDSGHAVVYEE